jgi:hypothetical protein
MKRKIALIFILVLIVLNVITASCPNGLVNDTYPGDCSLYTDENKDNICDYSQEIEEYPKITQESKIKPKLINTQYYFLLILIISTILYFLSSFLSRKGKIYSPIIHKKIWNILLLVFFLGVGISGILFVLRLEFGMNLSWFPKMLFWHVETGIIMAIISIFHIIWHWKYFKSYFSNK